jgi:hypothetical protein
MTGSTTLCKHLPGDGRELLCAGWQPAFQFGRQGEGRFSTHHACNVQ